MSAKSHISADSKQLFIFEYLANISNSQTNVYYGIFYIPLTYKQMPE